MHADADDLDSLARSIRDAAHRADEQAHQVRRLAATLEWTGAAGDAFRARMAQRAAACATTGADLLAATAALQEHADAIRTACEP